MKAGQAVRAGLAVILVSFGVGRLSAWTGADYDRYDYESFAELPAANRRIDMGDVDRSLLNAALFYETNRARAAQGRAPLRHSPALERAAAGHSRDMARRDFLAHESPVPGKRSLADRLAAAGADLRSGVFGENIGTVFGIRYESGTPVSPPTDRTPYFRYPDGRRVPRRTYLQAGRAAVEAWMESPGHRKNLLDPRFTRLGTGSARYEDDSFHGVDMFKVVQVFAGE